MTSPLDEVMEDIRQELVRRVAAADRDANRDVYRLSRASASGLDPEGEARHQT
jgi:hypothetical protein